MNLRKLQKLYARSINRIVTTRGRLPSVVKSFIAALLSFTLVVTWGNAAWGQLPFLNLVEGTDNNKPIVDFFNRPYKCGNLVCTQIWFTGMPILEIASEPTTDDERESSFSVELRAKRIQNTLQQILRTTIGADSALQKSSNVPGLLLESALAPITDRQESVSNLKLGQATEPATPQPATPQPATPQSATPQPATPQPKAQEIAPLIPYLNNNTPSNPEELHPNTPQIEVGTLNAETVVFYIPKEKGLSNLKIMTVTRADVLHHGQLPEELAQQWRNRIRSWFSFALAERDLQAQTPLLKPAIIGGLLLLMILLGFGVGWVQKRTRDRYRKLKTKLRELEESLAIDPESATSEQLAAIENPEATEEEQQPAENAEENTTTSATTNHQPYLTQQLGSLWRSIPKFSLEKHSVLKQQQNLTLLLLQILIWVQALIWVWGTGFIFWVYPSIRAIGYLLLEKTFPIIGIWVLVTLADKVGNFLIDANLNAWAENAQLTDQSSPRYALRVSTYSAALNNLSSVIFWLIGIIWTAEILGIATTVLASAGIIAVIVTYFSQNLVRDAINGLLILWTDRYAVGDVILVGDVGGFVEKMNLYMTNLRSADGEFITIPNGSITVVRNLTKDWSRVNFTIEVAYDADIKRALQILRQVADEFYADPDWQEHLVEPIEVLGVDEVSHAGMLVRIWLKTQPLKQWLVGRGFRLRVKEAFDREGIAIGIPQRSLFVRQEATGKRQEATGNGQEVKK
jgi:small conductance mechanosensitive channel